MASITISTSPGLEVLKILAEDDRVRVRVFEDYSNLAAIKAADFLVSYTCDVIPRLDEQEALRDYVEKGEALVRPARPLQTRSCAFWPMAWSTLPAGRRISCRPSAPCSSPIRPSRPYRVEVADPSHPLVAGVEPFEATDEHYLVETYGDLHVLLDTEFERTGGPAWSRPKGPRPGIRSSICIRSARVRCSI